jgi:hypothetical protein
MMTLYIVFETRKNHSFVEWLPYLYTLKPLQKKHICDHRDSQIINAFSYLDGDVLLPLFKVVHNHNQLVIYLI